MEVQTLWAGGNNRLLANVAGSLFVPQEIGGGEYGLPSQALLDSFLVEKTVDGKYDPRAEATIAWDHYPDDPDYTYYQHNYHDTWGGNGKIYNKKFASWWLSSEPYYTEINMYGMRYANVLLLLAEAYTMKGNVAAAAPLVKRIRDRAKLADKHLETYTADQLMSEIRRQRNLEFAYEDMYMYDERRWGILADKIAPRL